MGKIRQLTGVAYGLADSMINSGNMLFLKYIEHLPEDKTKLIEIDLLNESLTPEEMNTTIAKKIITGYKEWFLTQLKILEINPGDIEKVSVKIAYKPGKAFAKYYTCNTIITAKGKEYTAKVMSSWS